MQRIPCYCKVCKGKLRDRRTVRSHYSTVGVRFDNHSDHLERNNDGQLNNAENQEHQRNDGEDDQNMEPAVNHDPLPALHIQDEAPSSNEELSDSSEDESLGEDEGITNAMYTDNDLERLILRLVESKVKNGWSQQETLAQVKSIYEFIRDERVPHESWRAVLSYLEKLGYTHPKHYKICFGQDHITLVEEDTCPNCGKKWQDCQDYFVLGLNVTDIFLNEETAQDHLSHYKAKNEWYDADEETVLYKELWNGQRFKELSYFWKPDAEYPLPTCCPNCDFVLSVEFLTSLDNFGRGNEVMICCPHCLYDFKHIIQYANGNPLNQAFIFHEDGFNAFVTKSRGISAIHISPACTLKSKRGKYLKVYSFLPTYSIPEGIRNKLAAFLKPLMQEVKELYINGVEINLKSDIVVAHQDNTNSVIPKGKHLIRSLLLLGTADLKAHAEITCHAGGGKYGCRRCNVQGTYIAAKRHYYYGTFGQRYRHPSEQRSTISHFENGKRIETSMTATEMQNIQTETGTSGLSILFELYTLYGFDPLRDMVMDRMHMSFNMLKRELVEKMWADLGANTGLALEERNPENGGLVLRGDFAAAVNAVEWPREEKASGVARITSFTDKMGSWKSNEFKKFSTVAAVVLAEIIPSQSYDCYILLCEAVQMLYCKKLQREGWNEANLRRLNGLLWSHAIRCEEYYGLSYCTENLEVSVHAADEIRRHSSMDNFSCELYERAIRTHKMQKHNAKGIEKTFVERESLRQFLERYSRINGPISSYNDNIQRYSFPAILPEDPFFFNETSFNAASNLMMDMEGHQSPRVQHAYKCGVAVGKLKYRNFTRNIKSDIERYLRQQIGANPVLPNRCVNVKAVALEDAFGEVEKFSNGDKVAIKGTNDEQWIMQIDEIIQVGPVEERYYTFVNGPYYIPAIEGGQVLCNSWTGTAKLVPRVYARDSVQFIGKIQHKVMMFPEPSNLQHPSYYLCIDYKNVKYTEQVSVPLYPDIGESVEITGPAQQIWFGQVKEVDYGNREAIIQWYNETRRLGVYSLSTTEDKVYFRSIKRTVQVRRGFGGILIT